MEIYGCWSGNSNGIESELFEWEKKNGECECYCGQCLGYFWGKPGLRRCCSLACPAKCLCSLISMFSLVGGTGKQRFVFSVSLGM